MSQNGAQPSNYNLMMGQAITPASSTANYQATSGLSNPTRAQHVYAGGVAAVGIDAVPKV